MVPKIIESELFKFREELSSDAIENLTIDGGAEKVKGALARFGYSLESEKVAVPIILIGPDGKPAGARWQVAGSLEPKAVKAEQIWGEVDKDTYIDIKIEDLTIFPFYNRCRNVSGWLDCEALTWSVFKKEKNKKVQLNIDQYGAAGVQRFCVRLCVLPISGEQVSLTLAFLPYAKDELKKLLPDIYSKTYCPQVPLTLGTNNTRAIAIKLAVEEAVGSKTGLKVFPLLEDMRTEEEKTRKPTSMEIRKALAKFLRTVQGLNNRIPKKLPEAIEEIKRSQTPSEPEWIWPLPHEEESLEPLEETGRL